MLNRMSDQQRADEFLKKWRVTMHWAYNSMSDAAKAWLQFGINGLPRATQGAVDLLQSEIAKNETFLASIRVPG